MRSYGSSAFRKCRKRHGERGGSILYRRDEQNESVLKAGVSLSDFSCLEGVIPAFLDQEQIFITKETKKGVSQMDIRPGIFSLSAHDGVLEFQVDASSAGNIKPYALLDALLSFAGKDTPPFWTVQFTRLETWTRAKRMAG